MGWILYPWMCDLPDLAQALRGIVRGSYRITTSYSHCHNTDRIIQQLVQQHALTIANQYQEQPRWTDAAKNLRAPYWDWASNSVPPPEVISLQTVNITTPDGNSTAVRNPLLQYRFNPISPSFPSPYSSWQTTIRHPDHPRSPDASTDAKALAAYDFIFFPNPNLSHSFCSIKVFCSRPRMTSLQVLTTFYRVLILGPLSVTTQRAMVVALVTLWKPYTTRFMVRLVVRWVTPPLLVSYFALLSY
jgi:hypothetical protein